MYVHIRIWVICIIDFWVFRETKDRGHLAKKLLEAFPAHICFTCCVLPLITCLPHEAGKRVAIIVLVWLLVLDHHLFYLPHCRRGEAS